MPSSAEGTPDLRLLDEVSWRGAAVPGGRTHALLAALVAHGGQVGEDRLVTEVWGTDDVPANPAKALQVVVSRARTQTAADVVVRTDHGYRLGLAPGRVDALVLRDAVVGAREAEGRRDLVAARDLARAALALPEPGSGVDGALGELRTAATRQRDVARGVLGRALSALGDHAEALVLLGGAGDDEASVVARLRSTAAVHGAASALEAYERHRTDLADRLGVDPGPALRALHAELLAADRPVREGLRFEATSLVGREEDVRRLRATVREARVTTILGPGGLGKTRLVHLLAREAEQPVVHVVELVGVAAPEDVVAEVGSALGVRDSVRGRRVLTAEQRQDVRARTAQVLDQAPALLVLDNCEHVVEAVAELVAFLVATCRHLRVVTTSRAPLAIAAERVFPLGQLDEDPAADLFRQRADAARPGVALPEGAVRSVVRRLDGLPLAIELAAAKVRAMSVEDVDRRLDDRFALLRGGDRSAPDRHQTLLAVIDWSWNLLADPERRALRWLSSFHDGFTLESADTLLGTDALDAVQSLVDQSLLTVVDVGGTVRYRMLETVREFGRVQLVGAGEDVGARDALLAWARAYAARWSDPLWDDRQVEAVRAVVAEETNLADCLRLALATPDPWTVAVVVDALGTAWSIKGENIRFVALVAAVDEALEGWEPDEAEVDAAVAAAAITVANTNFGELLQVPACTALLERYADRAGSPRLRGTARVVLAQDADDTEGTLDRLHELARTEAPPVSTMAHVWAAHHRENSGDPRGAIAEGEAGLALHTREQGPWLGAQLHTLLASLHAQVGDGAEAARHARAALPPLDLLESDDDGIQVRSLLASDAMAAGDTATAERYIAEIDALSRRGASFGGDFVTGIARAELALVRGDTASGLATYRRSVGELASVTYPGMGEATGMEPWALYGESANLTAHAVHGEGEDGRDLYDALAAKVVAVVDPDRVHLDYPLTGVVLYALGAWGLLKDALDVPDAVRLLVLADLFAYARYTITMSPAHTAGAAEERAPGLAEQIRAEYGARSGPDLLAEARAVVLRLFGG